MVDRLPPSDRDPDDLDAAASDHVDDPAATPVDREPLASRIASFERIGEMIRDVPAADDVARRRQIHAALDTMAPPAPSAGTRPRRYQIVGIAAGIIVIAGAAIGLSALAGTISPGEESETLVADASDDETENLEEAQVADDAGATPNLGEFDTVEDLVDVYRSTAARAAAPAAAEATAEADLESTAGAATDAVEAAEPEVPAFESRCNVGDGVATGLVTGRIVIVIAPAPDGDVIVVFLDDCSVVPVPSSP